MRCIITTKKAINYLENQKHGIFNLKVASYIDGRGRTCNYLSVLYNGTEIAKWACPVTALREDMLNFVDNIKNAKNIAEAKKACEQNMSMSRCDFNFACLAERVINNTIRNNYADYVTYEVYGNYPSDILELSNLKNISNYGDSIKGMDIKINNDLYCFILDNVPCFLTRTAFVNAIKQLSSNIIKNNSYIKVGRGVSNNELDMYIKEIANTVFNMLKNNRVIDATQTLKQLDKDINIMGAV